MTRRDSPCTRTTLVPEQALEHFFFRIYSWEAGGALERGYVYISAPGPVLPSIFRWYSPSALPANVSTRLVGNAKTEDVTHMYACRSNRVTACTPSLCLHEALLFPARRPLFPAIELASYAARAPRCGYAPIYTSQRQQACVHSASFPPSEMLKKPLLLRMEGLM